MQAVQKKDINAARLVFETAFWNSADLVPDWHHLLIAALKKDKPMIRLLAAHGATWTDEETRCLKNIFFTEWPELTATLRNSGVAVINPAQPSDIYNLITMSYRIISENKDAPVSKSLLNRMDDMLSKGIVVSLAESDIGKALQLLRFRQPQGLVDIDREFRELLLYNIRDNRKTLKIIDSLNEVIAIKPIQIDLGIVWYRPEIIDSLNQRGLLHAEQPERLRLIEMWSGANPLFLADRQKMSQQEAETHYQQYKAAAAILFRADAPPTYSEADRFIRMHKAALQTDAKTFDRVCSDLKAMGFFNTAAWTKERLHALGSIAPEGSSLKQDFNRKLAGDRFRSLSGRQLLKPENLKPFIEAHLKGHYQAVPAQGKELLDHIHEKYKNGALPDEVKDAIRWLKDYGARFMLHSGNDYLGKKEPGLAKVLLDIGLLKPNDFNRDSLRRTVDKSRAFADFYRQVFPPDTVEKNRNPSPGKNTP